RCQALNPATNGAGGYFDTDCSPLNPHNAGAGFYAYGTLPLFMAHFIGDVVQQLETQNFLTFDFQGGTLTWRFLSAFFDVGTIILIFFTASRMHNRWVGLLAAVLYAAAPLAIQKAHFGTVNSVTAFFVMLALWAAVAVQDRGRYGYYAIFGIAVGAAVSGRINTAPLAGVVVLAAILQSLPAFDSRLPWSERNRIFGHNFVGLILSGALAFLTFRVCNPYTFQGPGLLGILPDHRWLADIGSGQHGISGASDGPPNWQWMGRPSYLFPLKDMFLWGMGLVMAGMAWFGWAWSGYQLFRGRRFALRNILIFVWVLVYFAWIGRLWVMTMRYYLPLYGALAIFAAWGVYELWRVSKVQQGNLPLARIVPGTFAAIFSMIPLYYAVNGGMTTTAIFAGILAAGLLLIAFLPGLKSRRVLLFGGFVAGFTLLWGVMFTNIYRVQATRVQASQWLWQNIPGDFSMQIEGAPDGKNFINIAVPNTPIPESITTSDSLYRNARIYTEQQPYFTSFVASADGTINSIYVPHLGDADEDIDKETLYISVSQLIVPETIPNAGDTGDEDETDDDFGVIIPAQPEVKLLATAILTEDLSFADHVIGDGYELTFDIPIQVYAGESYDLKIESLGGNIIAGGSVVLTEGDWDDRLTTITACTLPPEVTLSEELPSGLLGFDDCLGRNSWTTLVHSYDLAMSYPVADRNKLENMIEGLHNGDYLAITSNRFYDTEPRNRQRFPLATRYYEALFAGELGYELIE
ncbi:MAG: glycosyltransferase family 39 protein, partial [Aggregatilineales bacterium]